MTQFGDEVRSLPFPRISKSDTYNGIDNAYIFLLFAVVAFLSIDLLLLLMTAQ
ncbi:MAG TPA: hypothetical protein VE818_10875 [Nitrososphaeraceae archaeon]|nr:hypothetical protein [Nitrososphaeraceae archaeon]